MANPRVPHVQPPAAVLEQMVTVRVHIDDCPLENGPLMVLPGSPGAMAIALDGHDGASADGVTR